MPRPRKPGRRVYRTALTLDEARDAREIAALESLLSGGYSLSRAIRELMHNGVSIETPGPAAKEDDLDLGGIGGFEVE